MRFLPTLLVPGACVMLACQSPATRSASLALAHVTVVDVRDGTVHADQTVLIDGNRLVAVAPSARTTIPTGARTIDATGSYLIPGLWDAHVHSAAGISWHFPLFLAHGITAVRNMHTTVDTALQLVNTIKQQVAAGSLLGPRMIANGPIIDGAPGSQPGAVVVHSPQEGRAAVDSLVAGGADFIKVYDNLTLDEYTAITDEARRRSIPVDGHMPFQVPPETGAAAGQRTVEHESGITMGCSSKADSLRAEHLRLIKGPPLPYPQGMLAFFRLVGAAGDSRAPALCARTVEAYAHYGVAVVPTMVNMLAAPQPLMGDSLRMRGVPARARRSWQAVAQQGFEPILNDEGTRGASENLRMLHEAHVPILAGTDVGNPFLVPGRSLHEELAKLVELGGLSPLEALQAATLRPAEIFGMADSLGTVEPDKLADLVLLDRNPSRTSTTRCRSGASSSTAATSSARCSTAS